MKKFRVIAASAAVFASLLFAGAQVAKAVTITNGNQVITVTTLSEVADSDRSQVIAEVSVHPTIFVSGVTNFTTTTVKSYLPTAPGQILVALDSTNAKVFVARGWTTNDWARVD